MQRGSVVNRIVVWTTERREATGPRRLQRSARPAANFTITTGDPIPEVFERGNLEPRRVRKPFLC